MPVFLRLRGRTVVLVGGGGIALRKARLLAAAGARLEVIAPDVGSELESLVMASGGSVRRESFAGSLPDHAFAAVAATGNKDVDASVAACANQRLLPVNVVDSPALCSFIVPSIIDRSPLMIAISSGGAAPVLVRRLRERLETLIPAAYGRLAEFLGQRRERIRTAVPDPIRRLRTWETLVDGAIAERVIAGDEFGAERLFSLAMSDAAQTGISGEVYLVGAGPGDPDLLTFRALRLMQQADVVFYDRLVSDEILNLVRRDAERIYVGKRRDDHVIPQQEINQLLVEHAKRGQRVLRLKGGDPFIFGRGGEEIETLAAAGVAFQVVPGITAASGCAAYAGIPLTHRDHAQSVRFVTGHRKDGELQLDWDALARPGQTLVFYMGLVSLPMISARLQQAGMPADTLVAIVEQGTTPAQRVLVAALGSVVAQAEAAAIGAPALLIVGSVVQLRERLNWFKPTD